MKQRTFTAIVILTILISTFLIDLNYNTNLLYVLGILFALIATKEMISMKETVKKLPTEIHIFSYLVVLYVMFTDLQIDGFSFNNGFQFTLHTMAFLCLVIFLIMVFRKNFSVNDAGYILLSIIYVGITFHSLFYIYNLGSYFLIYVILITTLTDTFAYFVGRKFGKHKLAPRISPKKTIEGSIGGTVVATILASIFAAETIMEKTIMEYEYGFIYIIMISIVISVLAQIGDLVASSMKRRYNLKDFGNIFPGHGGVLDRLDSILYASLAFFYILNILQFFNVTL